MDNLQRADQAQQLINNPLIKEAFDAIEESLKDRILNTPTTDKEIHADIARVFQIFAGFKLVLHKMIADGKAHNSERNIYEYPNLKQDMDKLLEQRKERKWYQR